jgi:hypothetical protein
LQVDKHGVVDGILVEPAHGLKVLHILVALEKLLDAGLDAVGNILEPSLLVLFSAIMLSFLGSYTQKRAPAQVLV